MNPVNVGYLVYTHVVLESLIVNMVFDLNLKVLIPIL